MERESRPQKRNCDQRRSLSHGQQERKEAGGGRRRQSAPPDDQGVFFPSRTNMTNAAYSSVRRGPLYIEERSRQSETNPMRSRDRRSRTHRRAPDDRRGVVEDEQGLFYASRTHLHSPSPLRPLYTEVNERKRDQERMDRQERTGSTGQPPRSSQERRQPRMTVQPRRTQPESNEARKRYRIVMVPPKKGRNSGGNTLSPYTHSEVQYDEQREKYRGREPPGTRDSEEFSESEQDDDRIYNRDVSEDEEWRLGETRDDDFEKKTLDMPRGDEDEPRRKGEHKQRIQPRDRKEEAKRTERMEERRERSPRTSSVEEQRGGGPRTGQVEGRGERRPRTSSMEEQRERGPRTGHVGERRKRRPKTARDEGQTDRGPRDGRKEDQRDRDPDKNRKEEQIKMDLRTDSMEEQRDTIQRTDRGEERERSPPTDRNEEGQRVQLTEREEQPRDTIQPADRGEEVVNPEVVYQADEPRQTETEVVTPSGRRITKKNSLNYTDSCRQQ